MLLSFTCTPEGSEEGSQKPADLSPYTEAFTKSWVYNDLHEVRNMRPAFNTGLGVFGGVMYSGVDSLLLKGRTPWTFKHTKVGERERFIVGQLHQKLTIVILTALPLEFDPLDGRNSHGEGIPTQAD